MAIAVAPSAKEQLYVVDEVEAIAGKGLRGDRYSEMKGAFQKLKIEPSQEVTLIETEAIDAACAEHDLNLTHLDTRRNLLTEGVALNDLVEKTFRVGDVTLRGIKLCPPCKYLERLTVAGVEKALWGRGGLRAQIVEGGTLRVGDLICQKMAEV